MRLELPDGQWAELREALTYGQAREVRRASLAAEADRTALADFDLAVVVGYVSSWYVIGTDGPLTIEQAELAPDTIIQAIARPALDLWNGKSRPKGETSSSTLRALG